MKLLKAHFENFRLLRDLEIDFSVDEDRNLTVIRAENESGKTTILNALQWGLYGSEGLPKPHGEYRMHPIDWDASSGPAQVTVTVDFQTTSEWRGLQDKKIFRIVRSVVETPLGDTWERGHETVRLYEVGPNGSTLVDPPQARIEQELPIAVREVFFTDGDRALTYIEGEGEGPSASVSLKRKRVAGVIRSLLGLEVVQQALNHVKTTVTTLNREAKGIGDNAELDEIQTKIVEIGEQKEQLETDIDAANDEIANFGVAIINIKKSMEEALANAEQDKLSQSIKQCEQRISQLDAALGEAKIDHSTLFRGSEIACGLLGPVLQQGLERLKQLRAQGVFPKTAIPVLEERLKAMVCICGESLAEHDVQGRRRRHHIEGLVEETRQSDGLQSILTEMYFGTEDIVRGADSWFELYKHISDHRYDLRLKRESEGRNLQALRAQVREVPNINLHELLETLQQLETQNAQAFGRKIGNETKLSALKESEIDLESRSKVLLRHQKAGKTISATREVARDLESTLQNAFNRITSEERTKVSTLMNEIFLAMIGSDPEEGAVIRRVEISAEDDILAYGPNDRPLNPVVDINGASRRALTIAFILALTTVSEVEAPNVVDTPLGMMSGYVRQSTLRIAIGYSSQIILFLTRDEIRGCEEILDAHAGKVITLTNSTHYPTMLVNDPEVTTRSILRCDCGHRGNCALCMRLTSEVN